MPDTYYPSLSSLLQPDRLPADLGLVKDAITTFFGDFYYRDLQMHRSTSGDAGFYSLKIITYRRLALEIPGTGGLAVILNPGLDESVAGTSSEFSLSLRYKWGILAYARDFTLDSFDDSAGALFEIVLDITGVTRETLLTEALSVLTDDPQPIRQFINLFNGDPGYSPAVPLQLNPFPTDAETIADVLLQLTENGNDFDVFQVIFEHYITEAASVTFAGDPLQRLERLFRKWFARLTGEKVKKLLIPHVSASIDEISVGVQFPRSVLREVNEQGEPVPDLAHPGEDKPGMLTCDVAAVTYSSDKGLDFDVAGDLSISVPRCEILRSGLILDIHEVKVDFSRTTNIAEAAADGRPVDFVGVYVKNGTISFPAAWNHDSTSDGLIKARNLLVGTGGISGTLALEAKGATVATPVVKLTFGKSFSVSLDKFKLDFKLNAIVDSLVEGTLVIPGFKDANDQPAEIRIKVDLRQNGDFDLTAHEDDGFRKIVFPGVFEVTLESVFIGRRDDDFYLGVAGSILFTHDLLKNVLKEPVRVEKLIIWSDGRFEIEGGTIPLPENLRFPIGPAEISISAIHLGSHQETYSDGTTIKFRYFGFDGAVDVNPGGIDVRGKGIKFYFPVDGSPISKSYLEIKSLAIDLVIPGSASRETAQLLISGFLSVGGTAGDPEYEGGVSFALPKIQIAGGAAMKYRPKLPAFLVDAFVELSVPIPLGATSLGIYGFRGLFGLRYVATKHAAGLDETKSWFDYYKVKAPQEGLTVSKFETPDQTGNYDSAISIGAGASLATVQDSGKTISFKLFVLLSLPDLVYLEGKANILGERVGLTGDDPMFFAVLAISSQSVETGIGVTYKLPQDGNKKGQILDLNAELRAAFFFKNKRAWFVNMGTKENPTTARVLTLFDATSYLMLSAAGIAAGAGVTWSFNKSYAGGMVRASVGVYIKIGGFISFQGPQIGGFAMLGGHVDASLMWFSFYIVIDTSLSVEVPRPFFIEGSVHLCVGVTIGFWKFKKRIDKCFDVAFRWEKDSSVDTTPVLPFADVSAGELPPFSATNMLSGETFTIASFGSALPAPSHPDFDRAVLPLDTWVDIEFLKGLIPAPAVDARIGRLSGEAPANAVDYVPPADVAHRVKHRYTITALEIRAWNGAAWVDYRPYEAMSPPDALDVLAANPTAYKDGFWLNTGDGYNKIRLLAETSLAYMQQGQPGWYVPEQMGITSASLFCRAKLREEHCLDWHDVTPQTVYTAGAWQQRKVVLYRVSGGDGRVLAWNGERSLVFPNEGVAEVGLPKESGRVRVKVTTFASSVDVRFFAGAALVETRTLTQLQLLAPVLYDDAAKPITRIELAPAHADPAAVGGLQAAIDLAYRELYETGQSSVQALEQQLDQLRAVTCRSGGITADDLNPAIAELKNQVADCGAQLAELQAAQSQACQEAHAFEIKFDRCFPDEPATYSYSIDAGRFRLHDDLDDSIVFAGATADPTDAAAETALFQTLESARYAGSYMLMNPAPHRYSFRVGDAQSPVVFSNFDDLTLFIERLRNAVQRSGFAPIRRTGGKRPCGHRAEHVDCWEDLPIVIEYDDQCRPATTVSAHEYVCRRYAELYRRLYAEQKKHLDDLKHRCNELTAALDHKRNECAALGAQLAELEQAAAAAGENGPLRPPDGMPCSTLIHEICYLTLEDHEFNLTIPGQAAIEQDYQDAVAAVEKRLTPIWRPHGRYVVHLQVADTVNGAATTPRDFYFGFRTAGSLGFWHTDPAVTYVDSNKSPDQYMLTGLKGYVDYRRSYPDPSGNVIGAKPLFYEDARILLFFTKRYVYHFFGPWPAYHGLPAIVSNAIQIVIKDPVEDTTIPNPPPPTVVTTAIPQAVVSWPSDEDPRIPEDVRTLLNLRNPELLNPDFKGGECWASGGEMIKPASVYTEIIPRYLRPLKLYTAIVNGIEDGAVRRVLSYVFQTSRYPDFKAQIDSYRLDDGSGNQRDAVFYVRVSLSPADVQLTYDIVTGAMSAANAALAGKWADPFDRIVQGVLGRRPLEPAIGTEFNVVRNTATGAVVAVWVRNPEPFNDPKLPDGVLPRTLKVVAGTNADPSYAVLFSRDRSQAFVMHPSRTIPVAQIKMRFAYVEWDGSDYVDHAVVTTGWIPTH